MNNPLFLVLGGLGLLGLAAVAIRRFGLVPTIRIVSGTPTGGVTIRRRG